MIRPREPGLFESLLPIGLLIAMLVGCVIVFKDNATQGPSQIALILAGLAAAALAIHQGTNWHTLEASILESIGFVTQAILILLLVGALIGTWILAGIVPALIVWGLEILSPGIFLSAACLICALVSMATGSSWSTAGTLGLALVGVGNTMGIPPGMSAGAVVSGAYFGDKMSPFSETTNLAASMTGTDLFVHIRHMLYTTVPAIVIALVIYFVLGMFQSAEGFDLARVARTNAGIRQTFSIGPHLLIPLLVLFALVARRVAAIPAIAIAAMLGGVFAVVFQPAVLLKFSGESELGRAAFKGVLMAASKGFVANSGTPEVNELLSRGGMASMLSTVWLILAAMFFSGVMEGSAMLGRIARAMLSMVRRTGDLVAAVVGTAVFMNVTASEQYLSIVLTGRMYRGAFEKSGLDSRNLSRALEDSGTVTSALIPWNTCGAFMAATLGTATLAYAPYAFLNWLAPLISIVYGYTGWTIVMQEKHRRPLPPAS